MLMWDSAVVPKEPLPLPYDRIKVFPGEELSQGCLGPFSCITTVSLIKVATQAVVQT